jgi:hypothetical protein
MSVVPFSARRSEVMRALLEGGLYDDDDSGIIELLKLADKAALRMLMLSGAVPSTDEIVDEFEQAVEKVGQSFELLSARKNMRDQLRELGVDIDFGDDGDRNRDTRDLLFDLEVALEHSAYFLGLAMGLRLAGSPGGSAVRP